MTAPPIDDTAICPACDGSGSGVADTACGYCGGCGGVPLAAAQTILAYCDSDRSGEAVETGNTGSTEGESAGPEGIAQTSEPSS